jgi:hypothetical protein
VRQTMTKAGLSALSPGLGSRSGSGDVLRPWWATAAGTKEHWRQLWSNNSVERPTWGAQADPSEAETSSSSDGARSVDVDPRRPRPVTPSAAGHAEEGRGSGCWSAVLSEKPLVAGFSEGCVC